MRTRDLWEHWHSQRVPSLLLWEINQKACPRTRKSSSLGSKRPLPAKKEGAPFSGGFWGGQSRLDPKIDDVWVQWWSFLLISQITQCLAEASWTPHGGMHFSPRGNSLTASCDPEGP